MALASARELHPEACALLAPAFAFGVTTGALKNAVFHADSQTLLYMAGAHFALANSAAGETSIHQRESAAQTSVRCLVLDPNKHLVAALEARLGHDKPYRVAVYGLSELLHDAHMPTTPAFNAIPRISSVKFPVNDHVKSSEVVAASFTGNATQLLILTGAPDHVITFWNPRDMSKPTLCVRNLDLPAFAITCSLRTEEDALYDFATISDDQVRGWRKSDRQNEVCRSSVLAPKLTQVRPFRAATYLINGTLAVSCGGSDTEEGVQPYVLLFKSTDLVAKIALPFEQGQVLVPTHLVVHGHGFIVAGVGTHVLFYDESAGGDGDAQKGEANAAISDAAAYTGFGWGVSRSIVVPKPEQVSDGDSPTAALTRARSMRSSSTHRSPRESGADILFAEGSVEDDRLAEMDPVFLAARSVAVSALSMNSGGTSIAIVRGESQLMVASLPADNAVQPPFVDVGGGCHEGCINSMSVCRNLPLFATGGEDGTVRIWNYARRQMVLMRRFTDPVNCVSAHPDGKLVIAASRRVALMEVLSNQLFVRQELNLHNVRVLAFSNHGHMFAVARQSEIHVYSTTETMLPRGSTEPVHVLKGHFSHITSLRWRGDDHVLLSGDKGGAVYEWNVAFGTRMIARDFVDKNNAIVGTNCIDVCKCEAYDDESAPHGSIASHSPADDDHVSSSGSHQDLPVFPPPECPVCVVVVNSSDSTLRYVNSGNGEFKMPIAARVHKIGKRVGRLMASPRDPAADKGDGSHKNGGFERGGHQYIQAVEMVESRAVTLLGNGNVVLVATASGQIVSLPWVGNGSAASKSKAISVAPQWRRELQLHESCITCASASADNDVYVSCDALGQIFVSTLTVLVHSSVMPSPIRKGLGQPVPMMNDRYDWSLVPSVVHALKEDVDEAERTLDDKIALIGDLRSEMAFKELINEQQMKDTAQKYEDAMDSLRSGYEEKLRLLKEDHNLRDFEATGAMRALEGAHLQAAEELETLYERKLAIEVARYQALKSETDERITDLKDEIARITREAKEREQTIEENHTEQVAQIVDEMAEQKEKYDNDVEHMNELLEVTDEVDLEDYDMFHYRKHVELKQAVTRIQNLRAENRVANRNVKKAKKSEEDMKKQLEYTRKDKVKIMEELADMKKRNEELQAELHAREELIGQKEQNILQLKRRNDTLTKHTVVLDHWQQEMRAQVIPREEELARLKRAATDMDGQFMKEADRGDKLTRQIERARNTNQALRKELADTRQKKVDCERMLTLYSNELALALTAPPGHHKDVVMRDIAVRIEKTLNVFRNNAEVDPEFLADKERTDGELGRQRKMLEQLNNALDTRNAKEEKRHLKASSTLMQQNSTLLAENAELRRQKKEVEDKLAKLETHVFQLEGKRPSSSGRSAGGTEGDAAASTPRRMSAGATAAPRGSPSHPMYSISESRRSGSTRTSSAGALQSPSSGAVRTRTMGGGAGFRTMAKGTLRTGGTTRALNDLVQWERERVEELLGRLDLSQREIERRDAEIESLRAEMGAGAGAPTDAPRPSTAPDPAAQMYRNGRAVARPSTGR